MSNTKRYPVAVWIDSRPEYVHKFSAVFETAAEASAFQRGVHADAALCGGPADELCAETEIDVDMHPVVRNWLRENGVE